jgi:hypothetical protein
MLTKKSHGLFTAWVRKAQLSALGQKATPSRAQGAERFAFPEKMNSGTTVEGDDLSKSFDLRVRHIEMKSFSRCNVICKTRLDLGREEGSVFLSTKVSS